MPALNFTTNDLSCAIGSASLRDSIKLLNLEIIGSKNLWLS